MNGRGSTVGWVYCVQGDALSNASININLIPQFASTRFTLRQTQPHVGSCYHFAPFSRTGPALRANFQTPLFSKLHFVISVQ